MFWISSFCYSRENDNRLINLLIGLYCPSTRYFQCENWLSAWLCICVDNWNIWLKYTLSVTQELLFAAQDEYARQINSYVQPYAVYELGCIFLAKSEVCLLHITVILKLFNNWIIQISMIGFELDVITSWTLLFSSCWDPDSGKGKITATSSKGRIFPCLLLVYIKNER